MSGTGACLLIYPITSSYWVLHQDYHDHFSFKTVHVISNEMESG